MTDKKEKLLEDIYNEILALRSCISELVKVEEVTKLKKDINGIREIATDIRKEVKANGNDIRSLQVRNTFIDNLVAQELLKGHVPKEEQICEVKRKGKRKCDDGDERESTSDGGIGKGSPVRRKKGPDEDTCDYTNGAKEPLNSISEDGDTKDCVVLSRGSSVTAHKRSRRSRKKKSMQGNSGVHDTRFQRKEAPDLDEVYIARSGLRSFTDCSDRDLGKNIFINPELHISSKEPSVALVACEKSCCIKEWYDNLNSAEKDLVIKAGFEPLINSIRPHNKPDTGLIQALAEKWWDTTHTFHFPGIGEMTMTPTDFSAITGIRVSGEPIIPRKKHGVDRVLLRSMLGPKSDGIYGDTVTGRWLWETYGSNGSDRPEECDVNVRAFVLALLAYVLLSNEQNTVPIAYIYCMEDVENIANFNWGATSLAYQYIQMDDLCRGSRTWLGGIWQSWEVWVKEYIPWIAFTPSPDAVNVFPRIRRWEAQPNAEGDLNILLAIYRLKFNMVQEKQVVWDVFTDKQNLPHYVTQTKRTTDQRVLLMGLQGGTWYLGERVRRQIAGVHRAVVPKPPPPSMTKTSCLRIQLKINAAVFGRPYRFFVDRAFGHSYEIYRNRLAQALSTALTKTKCGFDDEAFKLPAWTVIVPTYEDESDIISIPMGKQ